MQLRCPACGARVLCCSAIYGEALRMAASGALAVVGETCVERGSLCRSLQVLHVALVFDCRGVHYWRPDTVLFCLRGSWLCGCPSFVFGATGLWTPATVEHGKPFPPPSLQEPRGAWAHQCSVAQSARAAQCRWQCKQQAWHQRCRRCRCDCNSVDGQLQWQQRRRAPPPSCWSCAPAACACTRLRALSWVEPH